MTALVGYLLRLVFAWPTLILDGVAALVLTVMWLLGLYMWVNIAIGARIDAADRTPGINWWRALIPGDFFEAFDVWRSLRAIPGLIRVAAIAFVSALFVIWLIADKTV